MFALGEGKLGWFFRENLNIPSLIWTSTPKMDTQNSLFFGKVQKVFWKYPPLYMHWERAICGVFCKKKIKIAFTYSHWEKPFAHPNSELFTKSLKIPFTYSHREKTFVRPNSEIFTKNSKSPLIMFALGRGKLGWFFEKKFSKSVIVTAKVPSQLH